MAIITDDLLGGYTIYEKKEYFLHTMTKKEKTSSPVLIFLFHGLGETGAAAYDIE